MNVASTNYSMQSIATIGVKKRPKQPDPDRKKEKKEHQTTWSMITHYFHKSFKKEPKLDEFELMLNEISNNRLTHQLLKGQRHKRELERLCQVTNYDKDELKLLYWGWKGACPEGIVNEKTFRDVLQQFFPQGEPGLYAHYVFNAMFREQVKKNNGQVTFSDYVSALSALQRGSVEQKLEWIFKLYDIDGDGRVTLDEMSQILMAIYHLLGGRVSPSHNKKTWEEHAKRVFEKLDANKFGYFTFDQFLEKCLKDDNIIRSMQLLETTGLQ